jgi:hypothetical protein
MTMDPFDVNEDEAGLPEYTLPDSGVRRRHPGVGCRGWVAVRRPEIL